MKAAFCKSNEETSCAKLLGTATPAHERGGLISDNVMLISSTPLGEGMDTCSWYSGPSNEAIVAFGEMAESCGTLAYSGESCGSIASLGGGESCGSIASGGSFGGGGGCSSGGGSVCVA